MGLSVDVQNMNGFEGNLVLDGREFRAVPLR